jgi:hypothetical protein
VIALAGRERKRAKSSPKVAVMVASSRVSRGLASTQDNRATALVRDLVSAGQRTALAM